MLTNNEKNINTLCENCCNRNDDSAKHADLCEFCQLNNNCLYETEFKHCLKPENAECPGCCCACEYENLPDPEDCFSFYLETLSLVNEGKCIEDAYHEASDKYNSFFIDTFEDNFVEELKESKEIEKEVLVMLNKTEENIDTIQKSESFCLKPEGAECTGDCLDCPYEKDHDIEDLYPEEFKYECVYDYEDPDEYDELCANLTEDDNEYVFDSNLVVLSV